MKLKSYLSFLKILFQHYRWKVILVVLFGVLLSFFQGVGIVMLIPIIESFEQGKDFKYANLLEGFGIELSGSINEWLLIYFFILLLVALFKALQVLFTQRTIARFSNNFAISSVHQLLQAKWPFFLKHPSSKLINLFNTESRSVRALSHFSFQLIKNSILLVVQLIFALLISFKLSLILMGILGLLFLSQKFFFKKNYKLGSGRINLSVAMQKYLKETFNGIKELKLYGFEYKRGQAYEDKIKAIENNEVQRAKFDAIADFLYTTLAAFTLIVIVYFSLNMDLVSIPSLLVLLVLFSRLSTLTNSLVKTTGHINNLLPSFAYFQDVLEDAKAYQELEVVEDGTQKIQSFSLKDIVFSIDGKEILKHLNLHFEKGNFYVLTGKSGVGKTITFDLMSGLIQPNHGGIYINGEEKSELQLKAYQSSITYVLQNSVLFGASIKENISFYRAVDEAQLREVIQKVGLQESIAKLKEGWDTVVDEDLQIFSGGEMQRIAIARALLYPSSLYIMDEVTNALDRKNEDLILACIQELKQNSIVVMITHKEYLFDEADHVYQL